MALVDNSALVNTVTLRYVNEYSLQVGPITDLMGSKLTCMGLGNAYTRPLGYVVIQVQVDGVWGYDEDQIALVILDFSNFVTRVAVILGMATISCVVNVMREAEIDALTTPWANARVVHLPCSVQNDTNGSWEQSGWKVWLKEQWFIDVCTESRKFRALLLAYNTSKNRESLFGRIN